MNKFFHAIVRDIIVCWDNVRATHPNDMASDGDSAVSSMPLLSLCHVCGFYKVSCHAKVLPELYTQVRPKNGLDTLGCSWIPHDFDGKLTRRTVFLFKYLL